MAPLVLEFRKSKKINALVCVTAQHRQILDQVLKLFEIIPDFDLNIMQPNQTLDDLTARVLTGIGTVLDKVKPDVFGSRRHDHHTRCFVRNILSQGAVGHVEAG